jgi:hypothetical protein
MYGYGSSDHSHYGYADEHHQHGEFRDLDSRIDTERWDRERAIDDAQQELSHRIDGIRDDNSSAREELWGELSTVNELLGELTRRVSALEHRRPRPEEASDGS